MSNSPSENVELQDVQNSQSQPNQDSNVQPNSAGSEQSPVASDQDQQKSETTGNADILEAHYASLGPWHKIVYRFKHAYLMVVAYFLFSLLLLAYYMKGKTASQQQDDQTSGEGADASLLPHSAEQLESSSSRLTWQSIPRKIFARFWSFIKSLSPFLTCWIWAVVLVGARPLTYPDTGTCSARQTGIGFVGNADFYGMGVRYGLYLQWFAAIIAIRFLPSARKFIVGSYLFYHFGMIVAMCLLILPSSCTFVPEVALILQLLWTGGALVLVPTQQPGTVLNRASQHLVIELITIIMTFGVFAVTTRFYFTLWLGKDRNFIDAPGGSFSASTGSVIFKTYQVLWIVFVFNDLFDRFCDKPRIHLFNELVDWTWHTSANLATLGVVLLMNNLIRLIPYLFLVVDFVAPALKNLTNQENEREGLEFPFVRWVSGYINRWYGLTRALAIMVLSIWKIENTIQYNNISEVQSIDSTGQLMPLAIGVVTVLSLMYLWGKDFLSRARRIDTDEVQPTTIEQAIGISTASGRWR